jgi:integrase
MKLGTAPLLVPADARKAAQHFAGVVAIGRDPSAEKKAARQAARGASAPVRDLIEPVLKRYLRHAKARTRESTAKETTRVMTKEVLPKWKGKRLSEVSKADVRQLIAAIAARPALVSANRALATIKTFFAYALEQDLISVSPAASVRPPAPEKARERVLSDDELGAVLQACASLGAYGQGIKLLALTGARRSEVFGMTWAELDMAARTWTLPAARAKNNRQHQIPLSEQALEVLASPRNGIVPKVGQVPLFEPVSFSRMKGELDKLLPANMPKWTIHDLRRSAASGMASLGVQPHVIEAVLNHRSGVIRGVAAVYNRHSYSAEKRAALDAWAQHVTALIAAREGLPIAA